MADLFHDVPIEGSVGEVFIGVATPQGLSQWWASSASGETAVGAEFALDFGPNHQWRAVVAQFVPERQFELEITESDADWNGTRVGFRVSPAGNGMMLHFYHVGWPHRSRCR